MAAVMLQLIPSFNSKYSKTSLFISAKTYEKHFVSKEDCIAHHDAKMCFLPNCRFHILLLGKLEELSQKLDPLYFTYQHADCFHTLFNCRFSGNSVVKSGLVIDNAQRAVNFNQRNRGVNRMPSIAKKRLLSKKYRKHLSSLQKTKSTQTSGSVFAEISEQVKETKHELEITKVTDYFLDVYDSYGSS